MISLHDYSNQEKYKATENGKIISLVIFATFRISGLVFSQLEARYLRVQWQSNIFSPCQMECKEGEYGKILLLGKLQNSNRAVDKYKGYKGPLKTNPPHVCSSNFGSHTITDKLAICLLLVEIVLYIYICCTSTKTIRLT